MFRSKQKQNLSIVGNAVLGENTVLAPELDLGVLAVREAEKTPIEGDPMIATPAIDALIELLAKNGHSVDVFIQERDRMKLHLGHHLTMFRSLAVQVDTTRAVHASR